MEVVPRGMANKLFNCDETRVSGEVYDLYRFLHQHPTMAPNRKKDVLRASVNYSPFGYIFAGLISTGAAEAIDNCLSSGKRADPCAGLQRDHFYTWRETSEYLFSRDLLELPEFWSEMKRRNEVVLLTKGEHGRVGVFQRKRHGPASYQLAGIELLRINPLAIKLSGNKAALVRKHWPALEIREVASLPMEAANGVIA